MFVLHPLVLCLHTKQQTNTITVYGGIQMREIGCGSSFIPPPLKVNVRPELSQRSESDEVSACLIICANRKHLLYEKVRSRKKSEKGTTLIKLRLQLTTLFTVD